MLYHKIIIRALITLLSCAVAQASYAKWYNESWSQMGTNINLKLWADTEQRAKNAITAVRTEMKRVDLLMSPYIKTSELAKINRLAAKLPVSVSKEMFNLIERANEISIASDGIFDITFASIGHRYNYRKKIQPTSQTINSLLPAINYKNIVLDKSKYTVYLRDQRTVIDLGGIAKGYAVESCISILRDLGIQHAAVTAGGDSMMLGDKRGKPWIIGIQDPRDASKNAVVLPLSNLALSTSGDYERYFMDGQERIHHIISPKTGKSAKFNHSVSIMGHSATLTDALSTTLFVLPYDKALNIIKMFPDYDAIIIDSTGKLHYSDGLMRSK